MFPVPRPERRLGKAFPSLRQAAAPGTANPDHKMLSLSLTGAEILVLNTTGWHSGV